MRRLIIVGATILMFLIALLASPDGEFSVPSLASVGQPTPTITAVVTTIEQDGGGDGPGGGAAPTPCRWVPYFATPTLADLFNAIEDLKHLISVFKRYDITVEYYSERSVLHRYDQASGQFQYRETRVCTDTTLAEHGAIEWRVVGPPDPVILLPRTKLDVEMIDAPRLDLAPAGSTPVNLGLWIAIEPDGPYVATASFNDDVWARTTATLREIRFDPGNGDAAVRCDGHGVPIPRLDQLDIDPGPCGYVYEKLSDVGDLTIAVSASFEVMWELSDGRRGFEPDLVVTASFPYSVYEIQTVGTGMRNG